MLEFSLFIFANTKELYKCKIDYYWLRPQLFQFQFKLKIVFNFTRKLL